MIKNVFIICFFFHSGIDDIEDGSELRRGQPVAHAIYGIPQTINSANYIYFIALERVLSLQHIKVSFQTFFMYFYFYCVLNIE